jgi:proton-dependent oligopeptide transporter, POT family
MLKQHPRGLLVLFFTEMWERFGFYTMLAIYALYMQERLGWSDARKGQFYGGFLGVVYVVPILGGWLGDRVFGPRATVRLGAALLAVGYGALALSSPQALAAFYVGLVLVAFGTGLFKGNMSVLVGNLYPPTSQLKDSAFNIFYMGINLGGLLGPVVATWISSRFGSYNLSFAAAAIGMLLSIGIFEWGRALLAPEHAGGLSLVNGDAGVATDSSRAEDTQRIVTLAALFVISMFFWLGYWQNGLAFTLFAQRSTAASLELGAQRLWLRPESYQAINPAFILLLTPLLVAGFTRARRAGREPSSAWKILAGLSVSGLALLVMVAAGLAGGDGDRPVMSPLWLITLYLLMTTGEILISPMGLSLVSKVAPQRMRGLMMGLWFAGTALGGWLAGALGGYYSDMPHHRYFLLIAGSLFFGALLAFLARRRLDRFGG